MSRHQRSYGQAADNGVLEAAGAFCTVTVCTPAEKQDLMLQLKHGENAPAGCVPSKLVWPDGVPHDAPLRRYGAARTVPAEDAASTEDVAGRDDVSSRPARGLGPGTTQASGTGIITRPSRDTPESGASTYNPTWSLAGTTAEDDWTGLWWKFYPPDAPQPSANFYPHGARR